MSGRRERYLEEMGLGPVWKLRGRVQKSEEPAERRIETPVAVKPAAPARKPQIPAPVPGLVGSAKLDLADDRAARILRMDWAELKATVADANKAQFDLDYTSGEEAVRILKEVLSQPKDIVDEFSKYIKFGE